MTRREGFICDGCSEEYKWAEPSAAVQDDDLNWYELCDVCYDEWLDDNQELVLE